ncbi:hypothetical protein AAEP93_004179 [Penicillium crustosum]
MTFGPKKHSHDLLLLHHLSTTASETTLIRQPNLEKCNELLKLSVPGASICIEEVMKDAREIFYRIAVSHPRFLSSIPSPVSPLSKLEYGLTTAHNPFGIFGLPSSAVGHFVSGASMAKLTAMKVARDQILNVEERSNGAVYISEQAHLCIQKAL